jgi:hypothetical protein
MLERFKCLMQPFYTNILLYIVSALVDIRYSVTSYIYLLRRSTFGNFTQLIPSVSKFFRFCFVYLNGRNAGGSWKS